MSKISLTAALRVSVAPAILVAMMAPGTALAQDSSSDEADEATGPIIVTGSRIRSPNLESSNPITVITGDSLLESGKTSIGDQLNDLPQLRNTYSLQNSTRFLGTRGLNLLDLRGLGTARTLVLVNGRRHVGSDILNNGVSPDVNTFPTDLIERIDIVTGGASAVYGSDAVAGVVNFVLKTNFEGLQMRGKAGISQYGDAGTQQASLVAGKNFADGRGNIAINLEFSHQADFYASGRPNLRQNNGFVIVDTDPAGSTNGADGVFDRSYFHDIRSATISLGGMVAISQGANAPCGVGDGSTFTCAYQFQPDGSLIPQTGTRIGRGPNGNFSGGNGYSGREGRLMALSPDLKRYSANLIGHYEISPALVPFIEAKYVRTEAFGSQSGPFFSQGGTLGDPDRERIRLDNPFMSAQARAVLTDAFNATTVNPNGGTKGAATIAAINDGSFRFNLRRNWTDFGIRDERIKRETFRIVGGLRGDFNDDWNYELSFNYGKHKERNLIEGNVNIQRYLLGVDSTRDAAGNIVCRSKVDPSAGYSYVHAVDADDPRLAGDIAACVPINPFGEGGITQAMRDYVLVDSLATGKITQFNILGYVNGDTSGFFNLPGGPVSFAVGGEYRRETNAYDLDDLTQEGYAFYNAIPTFTAPALKVTEAFGELKIPILADVPFFQELSLHGSARMAKYSGAATKTGTVYAYGGEATWKPVQDITFRGSYARSVRAPNLQELYGAVSQNFAPGFADPCSARNIGTGSANRAANCAAAGIPTTYDFVYTSSLEIRSGGNIDLREETSTSKTLGVILQPRFVPGLSLSADYYDIKINGAIASVSAQDIADLCYDLPNADNQYCPQFQRAGASGGPAGEEPFQILQGSMLQSSLNFASLRVRGVDVNLDYRKNLSWGELRFGAVWTHVFENRQYNDPLDPTYADSFYDELNDPSDQFNLNASLKVGRVTFGYEGRWLDKMYLNTYEDYNSINGDPPENADYAPIAKYPSVMYHDISLGLEVNEKIDWYAGVDNVLNKKPPYGLTGIGGGSGIYDNRGRYFYTGFTAKF